MNQTIDISHVVLQTERLKLRPWKESDLDDFYEYAKVEGVGELAGWCHHQSKDETKMILDSFIKHKKTFALVYQGKVIGSLGIECYNEKNYPELDKLQGREIGYVLSKEYWGQGIMPEAVKAVIQYLFDVVQLDFILVGHFTRNHRSERVIQKCGFSYIKTIDYETRYHTIEKSKEYILYHPQKHLKLVKLTHEYQQQLFDMMDEWTSINEKIVPYAIRKVDYHDFDHYLQSLDIKEHEKGLVPDSTFFCLDVERNIFVGAVNIRHYLNEQLLLNGGHIGDGVRPSERRKGIATQMIALALEECRKLGIDKVLMVCDKNNIASAKSIMKNGGILENEIVVDDIVEQRYWISLQENEDE
ncbi:MAG: GNAT family N-acetyltransferase [Traorella sp.]